MSVMVRRRSWRRRRRSRARRIGPRSQPRPGGQPMAYVDGFVLAVPKRKLPAYKRIATKAGRIWREHGALEYRECVGDDLAVKMGLPFPRLVRPKSGETIVFSWI